MDQNLEYLFFTVLFSSYNAELYIKVSLNSIINKTFSNLSIVVINDFSIDIIFSIVNSLKDKSERIQMNNINLGLIKSLNFGLAISKDL